MLIQRWPFKVKLDGESWDKLIQKTDVLNFRNSSILLWNAKNSIFSIRICYSKLLCINASFQLDSAWFFILKIFLIRNSVRCLPKCLPSIPWNKSLMLPRMCTRSGIWLSALWTFRQMTKSVSNLLTLLCLRLESLKESFGSCWNHLVSNGHREEPEDQIPSELHIWPGKYKPPTLGLEDEASSHT